MKIVHRNDSAHTARTRDAALRRLAHANRWLIAGTAVLTGVLTDVAANAFPGHSVSKGTAAKPARTPAGHQPLTAPAQAPKPATTTQETAPQTAAPSEAAPAETQPPSEPAPAPSREASPEPAPAEETPKAEAHEAAPPAEEPAPVVSGGS